MARKKEKAYYPIDELFKACNTVFNFFIHAREHAEKETKEVKEEKEGVVK